MNIIQTWKEDGIPPPCVPFVEKVLKLNRDSTHLFFNDKDINNFVNQEFPEYYNVFTNFKYKIQQIDFFRYLAVYYYGGIYLDIDVEINKSLNDLDKTKCVFPVEYCEGHSFSIGNYIFYSPEKHPFIKHIIDTIIDSQAKLDYKEIENEINNSPDEKEYAYVYSTTGPSMIMRCYESYIHKDEIVLLKPEIFEEGCFGDYGKHHEFGFWKNRTNNLFNPMKPTDFI
jgi:mannosyltransferase OCH1-like enzyme